MINITPNAVGHFDCEAQHRMLEHLHSTPLPAVISAEIGTTKADGVTAAPATDMS